LYPGRKDLWHHPPPAFGMAVGEAKVCPLVLARSAIVSHQVWAPLQKSVGMPNSESTRVDSFLSTKAQQLATLGLLI
jgi:hypothetical protein